MSEAYVITGDKRSLLKLASSDDCREIAELLCGRIFCFEQVLDLIVTNCQPEVILPKLMLAVESTDHLYRVLLSQTPLTVEHITKVLNQIVARLKRDLELQLLVDLDE